MRVPPPRSRVTTGSLRMDRERTRSSSDAAGVAGKLHSAAFRHRSGAALRGWSDILRRSAQERELPRLWRRGSPLPMAPSWKRWTAFLERARPGRPGRADYADDVSGNYVPLDLEDEAHAVLRRSAAGSLMRKGDRVRREQMLALAGTQVIRLSDTRTSRWPTGQIAIDAQGVPYAFASSGSSGTRNHHAGLETAGGSLEIDSVVVSRGGRRFHCSVERRRSLLRDREVPGSLTRRRRSIIVRDGRESAGDRSGYPSLPKSLSRESRPVEAKNVGWVEFGDKRIRNVVRAVLRGPRRVSGGLGRHWRRARLEGFGDFLDMAGRNSSRSAAARTEESASDSRGSGASQGKGEKRPKERQVT